LSREIPSNGRASVKKIWEVLSLAALTGREIKRYSRRPDACRHLPHVSKLISLLLCNDPNKNIISFKIVGVVCLERDESKAWSVEWMLIPDLVLEERTRVVCNGL
jgi:hypothetical protein